MPGGRQWSRWTLGVESFINIMFIAKKTETNGRIKYIQYIYPVLVAFHRPSAVVDFSSCTLLLGPKGVRCPPDT